MSGNMKSMFRREIKEPDPPAGGISGGAVILCALAALCIVTLDIMAAARVSGASRLTQASVQATEAYYAACLEANRDIADMRSAGTDVAVSRDYPISDTMSLHVRFRVSGGSYEILEWRSVNTGAWEPDTGLDVAK